MGSIVSALTGSGSSKAASAQAGAASNAKAANQASLLAQLRLGQQALDVQQDMFLTATGYMAPYRDAGTVALARYESLLYGIPINQTASYNSAQSERNRSYEAATSNYNSSGLPADAIPYTPNYKSHPEIPRASYYLTGDKVYMVDGDQVYETERGPANWYNNFRPVEKGPAPEMSTDPFAGMDVSQAFDFTATPSYQFRLSEGEKALERSAAARSGVLSGAQVKALMKYGQDMATQEFDNVLNRLAGLIDTGFNAASGSANTAMTNASAQTGILNNMANAHAGAGQTAASLETQIGAAKASGYLGQQAAGTSILNNAAQMFGATKGFGLF